MKRAFTLIEVNLAILVMAGGILSIIVLYTLGFRESSQSREDIVSAAYADAVMSPIVAALSATDLKWSTFNSIRTTPSDGWGGFLDSQGRAKKNTEALSIASKLGVEIQMPESGKYASGLVICHEENSGIVKVGFRAAKKERMLLAAPLYYTEVRFQGVVDEEGGKK